MGMELKPLKLEGFCTNENCVPARFECRYIYHSPLSIVVSTTAPSADNYSATKWRPVFECEMRWGCWRSW